MSHAAIAAVLRLEDVGAGERLAAFSLASFANREHRAWPGTQVAAARAGLSHSQYLAARDGMARRGLVEIDEPGGGRGRSPVVSVLFAESGPWWDADVNPGLVEAVLSYSRTRGSARVLLATLAAVADQHGAVAELCTDEIQAAAGMADSTYRRARSALLDCGELVLAAAGGGRARTNHWAIPDPRSINPEPVAATRPRPAPRPGARPLLATARAPQPASEDQLDLPVAPNQTAADQAAARERMGPGLSGVSALNPGQNRTVSAAKGLSGVSDPNPAQDRTVCGETPPQTPSETPPLYVRAGREPQNPRIRKDPPTPPEGGRRERSISIVEDYVTDRGRKRQRTVTVSLDEARSRLVSPSPIDRSDWQHIYAELERAAGGSAFEIWLSALELVARDPDGTLLLVCPAQVRGWINGRYGPLLDRAASRSKRTARLAGDSELQVLHALGAAGATTFPNSMSPDHKEAV